jgi:prepilin-type N-terminal cleavage/methylation domain-containing protein
MFHSSHKKGFTLLELVITITILSMLALAVFAGVDPKRRLNSARNAKRWSDITIMLDAFKAYQFDHNDAILENPTDPTSTIIDTDASTVQIIGRSPDCSKCITASSVSVAANCALDLSRSPTFSQEFKPYLPRIPADPYQKTETQKANDTRYYINDEGSGVITIGACNAESDARGGRGTPNAIEVTR